MPRIVIHRRKFWWLHDDGHLSGVTSAQLTAVRGFGGTERNRMHTDRLQDRIIAG